MTTLFVYGTLKRGGSNHGFLAGQRFLGMARTGPGYTLYALDTYPGMIADSRDINGVIGELWQVDAACLAQLDRLEGVDQGLYRRAPIVLADPSSPAAIETYLYLRDLTGRRHLGESWPI